MDKSNINQHIGNKFQEYRLKNNLTQNQVSELTANASRLYKIDRKSTRLTGVQTCALPIYDVMCCSVSR